MSVDRRGFLLRAGAFVGALLVARTPQVEDLFEEAPLVEEAARPAAMARPLYASSGLCAPVTPYYSLPLVEARPLRDALPGFSARRHV